MKALSLIAVILLVLGLNPGNANEKKIVGGPKGGRLLDTEPARAEFFVEKDRKVWITFYDKDLNAIPVKDQVVNVIAEPKSGKTKVEMQEQDGALVSKVSLPEGDGYNVIVQVKANPDAKPKNFRIAYEEYQCGGCKRAEYACTCGH